MDEILQTTVPFSLLLANWNPTQQQMYDLKNGAALSFLIAFATVLTQYVVSEWIWNTATSKSKKPHSAPVYLVSGVVFILLWSFNMNSMTELYNPLPLGYKVATPLLAIGGFSLNLLFCFVWYKFVTNSSSSNNSDEDNNNDDCDNTVSTQVITGSQEQENTLAIIDIEQGNNNNEKVNNDKEQQTKKEAPMKMDFINNIKMFLTCLVIINHVIFQFKLAFPPFAEITELMNGNKAIIFGYGAMIFLNSFHMFLFFFFSGYFVPKSFDKRGAYTFLFERIKRLGIPLVIMSYLLFPYANEGAYMFEGYKASTINSIVYPGAGAWFLLHLILFNIAYSLVCGAKWNPKIECPSLLTLGLLGLFLAVIGATFTIFFPVEMVSVPNFWLFYIGYICFFFGGAVAQRNNWLEELQKKSRTVIYTWAVVSTTAFFIAFFSSMLYLNEAIAMPVTYFFMALNVIPACLAVTVFFMDFVNGKYFCTDFFSKSMYTAYLIHMSLTVPAAIKCWQLVMSAADIVDNGLDPLWYLTGILFSTILGMVFTWPLSYMIRSIPSFSNVL